VGQFRIEITAVGNHGEARDTPDGGQLDPEGYDVSSADLLAFELVQGLRDSGASVESATLTHWPGQPDEVVDDLLTKTRHGSFR
jgi:hypothetical protein